MPIYDEMRSRAKRLADEVVKERVLAGLAALREEYGEDFADHISVEELDMGDSDRCVVGQLSRVCEPENANIADFDERLGFDTDVEFVGPDAVVLVGYVDLDRAWKEVLA